MARIYNQIGSLTQLISELKKDGIYDFETMDDIRKFRNDYNNSLEQIREKNKDRLRQEIINFEQGTRECFLSLIKILRREKIYWRMN